MKTNLWKMNRNFRIDNSCKDADFSGEYLFFSFFFFLIQYTKNGFPFPISTQGGEISYPHL